MSFCNLSAKILPTPRNNPQRRRRLKTQHTLIPNPPKPPDESLPIRMFSLVFVNVNGIWCKSPTPSLSWICNAFSRCPSRVRNFPKSIPAKFPFPISKAVRINCPSNPISLSPHKSRSQPVLGFPEQAQVNGSKKPSFCPSYSGSWGCFRLIADEKVLESFSYLKDAIYIYPKMSGGAEGELLERLETPKQGVSEKFLMLGGAGERGSPEAD